MDTLGLILYKGKSLLNGKPIVVIATGIKSRSKNGKTGDAIQTWILSDETDPISAVKGGEDTSICGDCPHKGKTCYVNVGQAPLSIYRAYKRGRYTRFNVRKHLKLFRDRYVRLGAYGDPAAVPIKVWDKITGVASHWTGYTHQWMDCNPEMRKYVMASCETAEHRILAKESGWRTFRVRTRDQQMEQGEFVCPASEEAGKRLTCERCKACSGSKDSPNAVDPVIVYHAPHNGMGEYRHKVYAELVDKLSRKVSLQMV